MADPAPAGRVLAQRPLRLREAPSFAPTVSEAAAFARRE
jgi:hypothetical protein